MQDVEGRGVDDVGSEDEEDRRRGEEGGLKVGNTSPVHGCTGVEDEAGPSEECETGAGHEAGPSREGSTDAGDETGPSEDGRTGRFTQEMS